MRCKYFAQKVVKVSFSWNFHTELEESSIRERKAEKSRFQDKKATKIQRNLPVELKFTLLTALKSGQMCRSGFPHTLDKDGVKRFLDLHSITVQSWFLEKKNEIEKLSLVKVKPPSVVLLHGIISLYSYFEKI